MSSFNDFICKYKLKNQATSNIKVQHVVSSVGLDNIGIYLGDGPFSVDIGIVKLHLAKGTPSAVLVHEHYFDSYGCVCPKKLSAFFLKRNRHCLFSEYKVQGLGSF